MARRLFTHYRRGLYINTGVGDDDANQANAADFCDKLNLQLDKCAAEPFLLKEWFESCKDQKTLRTQRRDESDTHS